MNNTKDKNKQTRKDIKILELGSGTGANLWFCAREGFNVYALDGSKTGIERMKNRFENENLSKMIIETYIGDYLYTLDNIKDNSIDALMDMESLCCNSFDKSKQIIQKAFDKLKAGGLMISQTFSDGNTGIKGEEIDYHAVNLQNRSKTGEGFTRYTTKDDIEKLYKLPNNKIINIEKLEQYLMSGETIKEWIIEIEKI